MPAMIKAADTRDITFLTREIAKSPRSADLFRRNAGFFDLKNEHVRQMRLSRSIGSLVREICVCVRVIEWLRVREFVYA